MIVQKELMEKVVDITRACGQIYKQIKKQDEANVDEYKVYIVSPSLDIK